jgi:predicted nucleic acid-binding protein
MNGPCAESRQILSRQRLDFVRARNRYLYNCTIAVRLRMEIDIDTSALLAVVAMEPERAELIRLTRGATLVAPSSVHWEIDNVLSAMFKRNAIELDDAVKMLEGYASIPIRLLDPPLRQAVELCRTLNIYAYDAYVIACATNQ